MNWTYILLGICLFFCLLNLILNFFIGLFMVRFQQNLFNYLVNFESSLEVSPSTKEEKSLEQKTWDQKYEEELSVIAERISKNAEL